MEDTPIEFMSSKFIKESTKDRLHAHGLKLKVTKSDGHGFSIWDYDGYHDDCYTVLHDSTHFRSSSLDNDISVKEFMRRKALSSNLHADHEVHIDDIYEVNDRLWRAVYDIGLSDCVYTATESIHTGDFNIRGHITIEKNDFLSQISGDESFDELDKLLEARFNRCLNRESALQNMERYDIWVSSILYTQSSSYSNACIDYADNIDMEVNQLIDKIIEIVDEKEIVLTLEFEKELSQIEINPLSYINRALHDKYQFKLIFGTPDIQGCTLSVPIMNFDKLMLSAFSEKDRYFFLGQWFQNIKAIKGDNFLGSENEPGSVQQMLLLIHDGYRNSILGKDEYFSYLLTLTSDIEAISLTDIEFPESLDKHMDYPTAF